MPPRKKDKKPVQQDPTQEKTIAQESGLPSNWVPVDAEPINPNRSAASPTPVLSGVSPFTSGPLPPNFGLQTDVASNKYGPNVPVSRLMPPSGGPQENAKIQTIVDQAIAQIPPAPGNVTNITNNGASDGLIHSNADDGFGGETIWCIDPAYTCFRDDFYFSYNTNGVVNNIGELNWYINSNGDDPSTNGVTGGSFGGSPFFNSTQAAHIGVAQIIVPSTSVNVCGYIQPNAISRPGLLGGFQNPDFFGGPWPLFDYPGWKMIWIFQINRYPTRRQTASPFPLTKKNLYIGLRSWNTSQPDIRPRQFVGLRFDTDPTAPAIADSTFHFECVANNNAANNTLNNTQGNVFNTGIVPKEWVWYRFEMTGNNVGQVLMSLTEEGSAPVAQTMAVPVYSYTSAGSDGAVNSNGIIQVTLDTASTSALVPWGVGSQITYTNYLAGAISITFTRPNVDTNNTSVSWLAPDGTPATTPQPTLIVSGYPALYPVAQFGLTSQAGGAQDAVLGIDFFGFVWNPGVGNGAATPNNQLSRYF